MCNAYLIGWPEMGSRFMIIFGADKFYLTSITVVVRLVIAAPCKSSSSSIRKTIGERWSGESSSVNKIDKTVFDKVA